MSRYELNDSFTAKDAKDCKNKSFAFAVLCVLRVLRGERSKPELTKCLKCAIEAAGLAQYQSHCWKGVNGFCVICQPRALLCSMLDICRVARGLCWP